MQKDEPFRHGRWPIVCLIGLVVAFAAVARADTDRLHLYVDADMTHAASVGRMIELGVRTALMVDDAQDRVAVIARDHRGNARRSLDTLGVAASDGRAIAVVGGMHSAPYLRFGDRMNDLGVPILLPWSSAEALTRQAVTPENWMFRVSVDDRHAGAFLADRTVQAGCRSPAVIAVQTVWGLAAARGIETALAGVGQAPAGLWTVPPESAAARTPAAVDALYLAGADCILAVTGPRATAALVHAVAAQPRVLPILSHWGLLGDVDAIAALRTPLSRVQIRILGTCGLHRLQPDGPFAARVEAAAADALGRPVRLAQLPNPQAFFQAFDATRLLLAAIARAETEKGWSEGADARRNAVRRALYALEDPVRGFLKTYRRPFQPLDPTLGDGHEALGRTDLCMARLDAIGRLRGMQATRGRL